MKYFTLEWCFSELDDKLIEDTAKEYKDYIDKTYEQLPFALKLLARYINLHDGKINNVILYNKNNNLTIKGVFGDLQIGYFVLEIKYMKTKNINELLLTSVFKNQKIEILSDEIEFSSKNNFSHRMLFSNKNYLEITFEYIEIAIQNATEDMYKEKFCQLEII